MSGCVKEIFDYDLVKRCCICKRICLKNKVNRNKTTRDGNKKDCMTCCENVYNENWDEIVKIEKKFKY